MPIYGSKFWNLGGSKQIGNFLTSQKLPLYSPANGQSVTYSKIHIKVCRTPLGYTYGLILGQIGEFRVLFKASQMCWKMQFFSDGPRHSLKWVTSIRCKNLLLIPNMCHSGWPFCTRLGLATGLVGRLPSWLLWYPRHGGPAGCLTWIGRLPHYGCGWIRFRICTHA